MRKSTHTGEYGLLRERLAGLRKQAGLSQRELARRLKVPHTWVAKVESGERRIDLIELGWFCEGCGVDGGNIARELMKALTPALSRGTGRGGKEARTEPRPPFGQARNEREGGEEVSGEIDKVRGKVLQAAFRMPSVQTMVSRKSSITNAFVNAIIPSVPPSVHEIEEALWILEMDAADVRCVYCGDKSTEWDHLRPLVKGRRPTGFISEIGNLVPACGKCNQSKGNSGWETWMRSGTARLSPQSRGVKDLEKRIERLRVYEKWRPTGAVDFEKIVGGEVWKAYWRKLEAMDKTLIECQEAAAELAKKIAAARHAEVRMAGKK